MLVTARLVLRPWRETDRAAFAALNADPEVARDLGGPLDRVRSDEKFDRYRATFERVGFARWAIDADGGFAGYAGLMPSTAGHVLGPHVEIGWRLVRAAWGRGYATEASRAALADGFTRLRLDEVLAYTSADNRRSRAVMERLSLRRDRARDFTSLHEGRMWRGLVWAAAAPDKSLTSP
jgi:RimJ/RimL family protein N-acetyltransferase